MKNKVIIFLLSASCIFMAAGTDAQNTSATDKGKFYISAGMGVFPGNWFGKVRVTQYNQFTIEPAVSYNISVKYFVSRNIGVALVAGYYEHSDEQNANYPFFENMNPHLHGYQMVHRHYKYSLKTLLVGVDATVLYYQDRKSKVWMYGSAGVGLAHTKGAQESATVSYFPNDPSIAAINNYNNAQQINENKLKGHLTCIGLRGGNKVCWFAECGYGFKGLVNAGAAVKL